jgi:PilZ domain
VDQRFDARYAASLDLLLTGLTDPNQTCRGRMSDISKSGLSVVLPIHFAPGALVKMDFADSTLFGYVVHSNPQEGAFRTGIEVERVLLGGTDLSRLLHAILKQEMPEVPGVTVAAGAAARNRPDADR